MTPENKSARIKREGNHRFLQKILTGLIPIARTDLELESEAIRRGAVLVEEDGDILWYQRKRAQAIVDTPIGAILNPLDECQLECDGITRIVSYLLNAAKFPHKVMIGSVKHIRTEASVKPHLWIQLEDGNTIDYRAKMWLGDEEDVPHGVFRMDEWTGVSYDGTENEPFPDGDVGGYILASVNGVQVEQMVTELLLLRNLNDIL